MTTTTETTKTTKTTKTLTIAQAIRRIKSLKGKLAEHDARANGAVSYREDRKPTFSFIEERAARAAVQEEMILLDAGKWQANATAKIVFGDQQMTIAEAVRRMQEIKADLAWLSGLTIREDEEVVDIYEEDPATGRNLRKERRIRHVSVLSEKDRVREVEELRARFEALNDAVETANHRVTFTVAV